MKQKSLFDTGDEGGRLVRETWEGERERGGVCCGEGVGAGGVPPLGRGKKSHLYNASYNR